MNIQKLYTIKLVHNPKTLKLSSECRTYDFLLGQRLNLDCLAIPAYDIQYIRRLNLLVAPEGLKRSTQLCHLFSV